MQSLGTPITVAQTEKSPSTTDKVTQVVTPNEAVNLDDSDLYSDILPLQECSDDDDDDDFRTSVDDDAHEKMQKRLPTAREIIQAAWSECIKDESYISNNTIVDKDQQLIMISPDDNGLPVISLVPTSNPSAETPSTDLAKMMMKFKHLCMCEFISCHAHGGHDAIAKKMVDEFKAHTWAEPKAAATHE